MFSVGLRGFHLLLGGNHLLGFLFHLLALLLVLLHFFLFGLLLAHLCNNQPQDPRPTLFLLLLSVSLVRFLLLFTILMAHHCFLTKRGLPRESSAEFEMGKDMRLSLKLLICGSFRLLFLLPVGGADCSSWDASQRSPCESWERRESASRSCRSIPGVLVC